MEETGNRMTDQQDRQKRIDGRLVESRLSYV